MLTFLLSKVGAYVIGGILIAALVGGGYMYVSHLRTQNIKLKAEVVTLKRVAEIYEHDAETDKQMANEKDRVDKLTPEQLDAEYDRLRSYGSSSKGGSTGKTKDKFDL